MKALLETTNQNKERISIHSNGRGFSCQDLLNVSAKIVRMLLGDSKSLEEARIAFMISPGFDYVAVQWGIWQAGGIAVPLCLTHPLEELEHVIGNAQCEIVISDNEHRQQLIPIAKKRQLKFFTTNDLINSKFKTRNSKLNISGPAMIIYTSGTTRKPKGAVITHENIEAQTTGMIEAWGWTANDRILSVLPLHHVHGITNVVATALRAGAQIDFLPKFNADEVWGRFINSDLTLFMAVPTIYFKLIEAWENASKENQKIMSEACRKFRLMVSGSAALPVSVLEKWKEISGHTLLERYGMTEIGMALSNPLDGERKPGHVGMPLPGVEVKLLDDNFQEVQDGESGQILIKGPSVFKEYWNEPKITRESFVDGWFKTGDMAELHNGYYKIIGRASVDIIKSGGYKISALEIEEVLREHPYINECAVVGIEEAPWGEVVAAAIIRKDQQFSLEELTTWLHPKIAPYKIPRKLVFVNELPRNALGKVVKPEVKKLFA